MNISVFEKSVWSNGTAGVSSSKRTFMNRSKSWTKNSCVLVYVHFFLSRLDPVVGFLDLLREVYISSEHKSLAQHRAFSRQIPRYFAVTICLSWGFLKCSSLKTRRARISLMRFTSLDNSYRLHLFFPEFGFVPDESQEFHGVSRRCGQSHFLAFDRIEFTGSEFLIHNLGHFFPLNCSLSTSGPRAEVTSHHQHVYMSNEATNASVSRLTTTTHGMMPIIKWRSFSSCQP